MVLYLAVAVMVLALAGMIWCAKKQKHNQNAQTYAVVCLVVVFVCAVTVLYQTGIFGESPETRRLIENEMAYSRSRAVVLGRYLAEKFPGSVALVITEENLEGNKSQAQLLESLKEGLGSAIKIEAAEPLPIKRDPSKPEEYRPMEEMMTAALFDQLIGKYKQANLIISMIGLPYNVADMAIWKMGDEKLRPKVALLTGDIHQLKNVIGARYIVAAVAMRTDIKDIEAKAPSDPKAAFDLRYLLITPENVVKISQEQKGIFE